MHRIASTGHRPTRPNVAGPWARPWVVALLACAFALHVAQAQAQAAAAPDAPPPAAAPVVDMQAAAAEAPLRVTLAQEFSYKLASPERVIKNRSSAQLEYERYFGDHYAVQLSGKATEFLPRDHRHEAEGSEVRLGRASLQSSFGQTSVKLGVQVLPWGESLVAPITDEVSPRDNRELFNFNLDELRVGQPMVVAEHYADAGRWSLFWVPRPAVNRTPAKGTAYDLVPFEVAPRIEGRRGGEVGASWRRNFDHADITLMAASLMDNDYALRMNADRTVSRVRTRFSMAGAVFTYAYKDFVFRGEAAYKAGRPYNDAAMQIVRKDALDVSAGFDYRWDSSLTLGVEAVNQHVAGSTAGLPGIPADRQTLLLSLTKTLMNDDLSINVLHFRNAPYRSNLTVLITSLKWDDHISFGLNVVVPGTRDARSGLWPVRDQKQLGLKAQVQF